MRLRSKISVESRRSKADVYSFGVVLLELLTGKDPASVATEIMDLPQWVRSFAVAEWTGTVLDAALVENLRRGSGDEDAMLDLLKTALDCCITEADLRLDMDKVERVIVEIRRP